MFSLASIMNIIKKRGIAVTGVAIITFTTLFRTQPIETYGKDTVTTISSVHITVDEALKDLDINDSRPSLNESNFQIPDTDKYSVTYADWYDSDEAGNLTVGSAPKVVVYLAGGYKEKSNGDEIIYRFYGSYTSSNVRITGGTFVSAERNGYDELQVVIQLKGVYGDYAVPENLAWQAGSLGQANWVAPNNTSGYYEVSLYSNTRKIVTITTNETSLNLYPWMTQAGDYTFSVTTIPYTAEQKRYGKRSEKIESDIQTVRDENKSDGSGKYETTRILETASSSSSSSSSTGQPSGNQSSGSQSPVTIYPIGQSSNGQSSGSQLSGNGNAGSQTSSSYGKVGWYQDGASWYFRYPSGELIKSSWLDWNGKWYHFDANGKMQTGWLENVHHKKFYLDPVNGDMKTGWRQIDNHWYYFNPKKDDNEGAMFQNTFGQVGNDYYYFGENGQMGTGWTTIKDETGKNQYYFFYDDGKMAKDTTIDGFKINSNGRWEH